MAFVVGTAAVVSVNGKDLSAFTNKIQFKQKASPHDTTTFGKVSRTYVSGLKDAVASLDGIYDNSAANGPAGVLRPLLGGNPVTLLWKPEGTGTGKPLHTVSCVVIAYEDSAAVADMVTWASELQLSDDVVTTTQP